MRFIIRELPYEKPLAAGQLRYELAGRKTGAVESWRLTSADSGYRFLRVDFDAREAESGLTVLYHMVLNERGRLERLSFRVWRQGIQISGNVLAEEGAWIASREVKGIRYEESLTFQPNSAFWFPSTVGLGMLANCASEGAAAEGESTQAVTLDASIHRQAAPGTFALKRVEVRLTLAPPEPLEMMGKMLPVRALSISWSGKKQVVWLDDINWPIKMTSDDGLTAVEQRRIRYT